MKLSVELYTVAERFGDLRAVEMVKEAGFDAIDYSYYYNKECEAVLGENYKTYAKELRAHLDAVGMVCNQAHAPLSLRFGAEPEEAEERFLHITRALESAAILGAENIIIHSITPEGVDFEEYNVAYYKRFIPYCEAFGIHVAVENLFKRDKKRNRYDGKIGSPEELNRIIRRIDSPWIVACVDVGHASLTGFEPEDFIGAMNPSYLKCLHVQDNDYQGDRHLIPYSGQLNWDAIMTSLKTVGYAGDLTFEIIGHLKKCPNELLPDMLKFAATVGRHLISIYEKA